MICAQNYIKVTQELFLHLDNHCTVIIYFEFADAAIYWAIGAGVVNCAHTELKLFQTKKKKFFEFTLEMNEGR